MCCKSYMDCFGLFYHVVKVLTHIVKQKILLPPNHLHRQMSSFYNHAIHDSKIIFRGEGKGIVEIEEGGEGAGLSLSLYLTI